VTGVAGGHSESRRQAVHMAAGGFALLLRVITWPEAVGLAVAAVAFNFYALPRIAGRTLYRATETSRRSGITIYPIAVLALLLVFPDRPDIVAGAWGILAAGDGMATIVGRRVRGPALPWNPDKTLAGTLALALFGGAAGSFLCWWCRPGVIPPPYVWYSVGAPFAAAIAAAAVESIPVRLDDNVSVPATAAAVLWWLSFFSKDLVDQAVPAILSGLPLALAVNGAVAVAGYAAGTVTIPGALGGAIIGITIMTTLGLPGWMLLFSTFGVAVITSRVGLRRKTTLGIAEERGGRRGAGNAIANTGVAAAAAVLSMVSYDVMWATVAFVAALAAGGSDTVASEIGKAWGRRTYRLPAFRRVAPGTSGAVSLEGTAAGLVGAALLAGLGAALGIVTSRTILPIVAGATIGSWVESLMGATLEDRRLVNNDMLNFLNTAIAAGAAAWLAI
jgi:uncharacterized protein (TIGR00297 family)